MELPIVMANVSLTFFVYLLQQHDLDIIFKINFFVKISLWLCYSRSISCVSLLSINKIQNQICNLKINHKYRHICS